MSIKKFLGKKMYEIRLCYIFLLVAHRYRICRRVDRVLSILICYKGRQEIPAFVRMAGVLSYNEGGHSRGNLTRNLDAHKEGFFLRIK
ncbi:hypothetical protein KAH81_00110 [bacterium]|nr:hypothetical protein [bacterium]